MKIGIIGTGMVGQTLGSGLVELGHEVKIGSREPHSQKLQDWVAKTGAAASTGTFAEAAQFGEVIYLATNWEGTENALKLAGPENLAGKVVIDAVNPLKFGENGPALAIGFSDSAGEQIQRWILEAKVVKALNTVGSGFMFNPTEKLGEQPDMFIAGNDADAKQVVTKLLEQAGWEVIDAGDITESRLLEPLAMLWIKHLFNTKKPNHAFKLIRAK